MAPNDSILNQRIAIYYEARAAYDAAKLLSDQADKVRREKETDLVSYMIENQIKSVALEDGTSPTLVNSVSISVTQENYDAIRDWLRTSVGDDTDFLVTIPHKPTILEHVKKQIEAGSDPTEFPDFLHCDTRPTLRVNGWKGR